MATFLTCLINYVDATVDYATIPANYIAIDTIYDYLIWTKGNTVVKDLMTHEPSSSELNAAATLIDESNPTTVPLCLLMDYSHNVGGSYYTHKVIGMSENKRYVFAFSFDGATATEPQLEAWDDENHSTKIKKVLGEGTAIESMLLGVCTTESLPGAGWAGVPLAGDENILLLNAGLGALTEAKDLYANLKIVIPADYDNPAVEDFVTTIRYTWC